MISGLGAFVNTTACLYQLPLFATCSRCPFDDGLHCVGGAAKVSHFLTSSSVLECSCMLVRIPFICVPAVDTSQVFQVCTSLALLPRFCRHLSREEPPSRPLGLCIQTKCLKRENGFVIVQMCALCSFVRVVADVRNLFQCSHQHARGRTMHPVTTCAPHEPVEILLLKQLNVTLSEAIV